MKSLHEVAMSGGDWKSRPDYRHPWHWSRRLKAFLGIHLPFYHRFDIRELFVRDYDWECDYDKTGECFHFPTYKDCWQRLFK